MTFRSAAAIAVLGTVLCAAGPAVAQQTPPPNPLDVVPEKMPFDIPYGAPISLDGMIGSRGGIPLIEGGKLIGAIGCSCGTGSQDEVACKAGAATIK